MSYRSTRTHALSLSDGRMVEPGVSISDADAEANPRLVERGDLVQEHLPPPPETNATDAAIRLAEDNNIDLATVKGTGKDGRITEPDVQAAVDAVGENELQGNEAGGQTADDDPADGREKKEESQ